MGFALSVGVQMLIFFLTGRVYRVADKNFTRVFMLAAIASFIAIYLFLHYKIRVVQVDDAQQFLSGCVGGWLAGLLFGVTRLKRFLLGLGR
jgi:hypothetical protein